LIDFGYTLDYVDYFIGGGNSDFPDNQ